MVPAGIPNIQYHLIFNQKSGEEKSTLIDYLFTSHDIVCIVLCTLVGVWYILKKVLLQLLLSKIFPRIRYYSMQKLG